MAQHAVHSSTLMDHVLLLVLLTIQPVVIPTTLVVCKPSAHALVLFTIQPFSECSFSCLPGHELNSSCEWLCSSSHLSD